MNRLITRVTLAVAALLVLTGSPASAEQRLQISVLSSPRPDLVSDQDALIEVRGAEGLVALTVNGKPSAALRQDGRRGSWVGLVEGLKLGRNRLIVHSGGRSAQLTLVNHSKSGPILSGPQITPFECRTVQSGLGPAQDASCNAPTSTEHFYRSTAGVFKPLTPGQRPADLANVTINGQTLPYIVRVESGTLNRTIYRIAVLDDPAAPQSLEWTPGPGWNGKLAVGFGGGLAGRYEQGTNKPQDALEDLYLSRGFAFAVATGLVNGLASNAIIQGETLMMLKEHFIERYGVPRWTLGTGGSGGGIQQLHITALYPGLLDGLQPRVAFADSTVAAHVLDCDLLQNYWKGQGGSVWSPDKRRAVAGFASPATCENWVRFIASSQKVTNKAACGLKDLSLAYDPRSNPKGARCGYYSWLVNQLGRDPKTGFARSPYDNVGVQYGLRALNDGVISVDEFLDLNERIGGFTQDLVFSPVRTAADPRAVRRMYTSGLVNPGGGGLGLTPIMQLRGYQDPFGDIHDRQRDFEVRLRLIRANGDADNQVIWVAPKGASLVQPSKVFPEDKVLDLMTQWLDAIASDPAPLSHAKVVRHRPPEAADAYFDDAGDKHMAEATMDPGTAFNAAYPIYLNPRIVAGGPLTNDVLKCRLKSPDPKDYRVAFSHDQELRLRRIFASGVCDFQRPGVGQVKPAGTYVRF
ncbi:DUF6351 family protein [Caulobacter radicis]|uniref:DUF6351 family protein n=1 Tax=Caulobacter radicis TaxID=2172650 RepID=UPI0010578615|nr:DUF6351 family protein [Caulobacter radicis]